MTRNGTIWIFTAALAFAALPTPGLAQQVSDTRLRELMAEAAKRVANGDIDVQQTTRAPGETTPTLRLTLDDAVKFALDRNLDIAVQRLNPQINDIAVLSVKSVYNPTLTSTVGPQSARFCPRVRRSLARRGGGRGDDDVQRWNRAKPALGRRQFRGSAEQFSAQQHEQQLAVQPALSIGVVVLL
jgi:hypothetical protein